MGDVNFIERYGGRAWLEREILGVFGRSWQVVLPSRSVASADAYVRVELGTASVVVWRTASGLAAYFNVCPHRGRALVDAQRGRGASLRCPYHHFTFAGQDGRCIGAPDAHCFAANPVGGMQLFSLRCEEFAGMVWVNPDAEAPPLRAALGRAWEWLEPYGLETWGVNQHVAVQLAANWKASADVHSEALHVHTLHPEVLPFIDDVATTMEQDGFNVRLLVPTGTPSPRMREAPVDPGLAALWASLGVDAQAAPAVRRASMVDALRSRDAGGAYRRLSDDQLVDNQLVYVFPTTHFNLHRDSAMVFLHRAHPTDPARSVFEQISLTRGQSSTVDVRFVSATDPAIGAVTSADLLAAEALQRGYSSGVKTLTPWLHPQEGCIAVMHQGLDALV